jgi:hypothetical protein
VGARCVLAGSAIVNSRLPVQFYVEVTEVDELAPDKEAAGCTNERKVVNTDSDFRRGTQKSEGERLGSVQLLT